MEQHNIKATQCKLRFLQDRHDKLSICLSYKHKWQRTTGSMEEKQRGCFLIKWGTGVKRRQGATVYEMLHVFFYSALAWIYLNKATIQQGNLSEHYRGFSQPYSVSICGWFHFRLRWEFPGRLIWQKPLHETVWTTFPVSSHLRKVKWAGNRRLATLSWSSLTTKTDY